MLESVRNFVRFENRLFIVYGHNKQKEVSQENTAVFGLLSKRYKIIIIDDTKELLKIDCENASIVTKDTIAHFKECLNKGGYVFLAFDDEELIFRCCVQKGPYECYVLGKSYLNIPADAYYIEYAETHSQYQGQKIYQWFLFEICEKLKTRNIYISTDVENIASQKGIEKSGFDIKEIFGILRFLVFTKVLKKVNYFGSSLLKIHVYGKL